MPKQVEASQAKKNLSGGAGFKRQGKEMRGHRKNRETTTAFLDDVLAGEVVEGVILARVVRVLGGARMQVLTVKNKTLTAAMRGMLRCRGGAHKKSDNPIAATIGTFVLLQEEEYGAQIVGVFNRANVKALQPHFPAAPHGFFSDGDAAEDDGGFEWDLSEGPAEGTATATTAVAKPAAADEEVDIDTI